MNMDMILTERYSDPDDVWFAISGRVNESGESAPVPISKSNDDDANYDDPPELNEDSVEYDEGSCEFSVSQPVTELVSPQLQGNSVSSTTRRSNPASTDLHLLRRVRIIKSMPETGSKSFLHPDVIDHFQGESVLDLMPCSVPRYLKFSHPLLLPVYFMTGL
ncbi:hypothetical protein C8R41DRAFT_866169 [Lentinula lateritia]|uniref:Uncharacterized protein n=1 Tax=Lentinula lateritia TaxID=40482 RepID=A0ABQ8VPN8_9AGAR|nr:hypothetical protein C8R41DRAFT_866169 [Lentinula lateritia]